MRSPVILMKPFYREFEHTSDLGAEVTGSSIENLFENAVYCLFDLMVITDNIRERFRREIELEAGDRALLLREMLSELLFLFQTEFFIVARINIISMNDNTLKAEVFGEHLTSKNQKIKREIKAITYHQLSINRTKTGYLARFVVDI